MDEQQWLTATHPHPLLDYLHNVTRTYHSASSNQTASADIENRRGISRLSRRQQRLFCFAARRAGEYQWEQRPDGYWLWGRDDCTVPPYSADPLQMCYGFTRQSVPANPSALMSCLLLRCIAGNPFNPQHVPERCLTPSVLGLAAQSYYGVCGCCKGKGRRRKMRRTHHGKIKYSTKVCLDCGATGHGPEIDKGLLPILADALEELAAPQTMVDHLRLPCPFCQDADFRLGDGGHPILSTTARANHWRCPCRGTRLAPHVRGCWVLDTLLDKE